MYQATKHTTVRIPPTMSGPNGRILPVLETNQIAGFVEYHPLTHREKNNALRYLAVLP